MITQLNLKLDRFICPFTYVVTCRDRPQVLESVELKNAPVPKWVPPLKTTWDSDVVAAKLKPNISKHLAASQVADTFESFESWISQRKKTP